ncbi:MAG: hypothetical protein ACHQVS_05330, partial [Candidatus Babeliales bacterium]
MEEGKSFIESRLARIDAKRKKINESELSINWQGDFPYPSTDGQMGIIDENKLQQIIALSCKKNIDFEFIKNINSI